SLQTGALPPSHEEWILMPTCWAFNFLSMHCNVPICYKQHQCCICGVTSHGLMTCPRRGFYKKLGPNQQTGLPAVRVPRQMVQPAPLTSSGVQSTGIPPTRVPVASSGVKYTGIPPMRVPVVSSGVQSTGIPPTGVPVASIPPFNFLPSSVPPPMSAVQPYTGGPYVRIPPQGRVPGLSFPTPSQTNLAAPPLDTRIPPPYLPRTAPPPPPPLTYLPRTVPPPPTYLPRTVPPPPTYLPRPDPPPPTYLPRQDLGLASMSQNTEIGVSGFSFTTPMQSNLAAPPINTRFPTPDTRIPPPCLLTNVPPPTTTYVPRQELALASTSQHIETERTNWHQDLDISAKVNKAKEIISKFVSTKNAKELGKPYSRIPSRMNRSRKSRSKSPSRRYRQSRSRSRSRTVSKSPGRRYIRSRNRSRTVSKSPGRRNRLSRSKSRTRSRTNSKSPDRILCKEFSAVEACQLLMGFCNKIGFLGPSLKAALEKTQKYGNDSYMILESLSNIECQELLVIIADKFKSLREEAHDRTLQANYTQASIANAYLIESIKLHLKMSEMGLSNTSNA
ncbi:unnamed protein product, partial [Meganyctiphanes norvegica]